MDLLNFVPSYKLGEVFEKEVMRKMHLEHRDRVLDSFICAYKAFLSGHLDRKSEELSSSSEEVDVKALIKLSLAFVPGVVTTFREVGVLCSKDRHGPHGYIDVVVFSEDKFPDFVVTIEKNEILRVGRLSAASAKTFDTFSSKGSDRQCVIEILALSEFLQLSNPDLEFVVLLKACKNALCLFIYFPQVDVLVRTMRSIPLKLQGSCSSNEVMGCFLFFLITNHQFNSFFLMI